MPVVDARATWTKRAGHPSPRPFPLVAEHVFAVVAAKQEQPGAVLDRDEQGVVTWGWLAPSVRVPPTSIEQRGCGDSFLAGPSTEQQRLTTAPVKAKRWV